MRKTLKNLPSFLCAFVLMACILSLNIATAAPEPEPPQELSAAINVDIVQSLVGNTASITASATGGSNKYEYKFVWRKNGSWANGNWGVIAPMSSKNTASFTPKQAGNYEIITDVLDTSSRKIKSFTKQIKINNWDSILTINSQNYNIGTKINLNGSTNNKVGSYTYKFVWQKDGSWANGNWGVISPMGKNAAATFTPTKPGKYEIFLDVQDSYGNFRTVTKSFIVSTGWNPTLSLSTTNTNVGTKVNLSADGNNNNATANLQHKFVWRKDGSWANGNWGVISPMGKNAAATFTPTRPGKYEIFLDTLDNYGNFRTVTKSFIVSTGWNHSLTLNVPDATIGSKMTAITSATNNNPNAILKYKFVWRKDGSWANGNWGVISNSSDKSSIDFTPTRPGKYEIFADVTDQYGNFSTVTKSFTMALGWDFSVKANIKNSVTTSSRNGLAEITANLSGKPGTYKYKFVWQRNDSWASGEWGIIQNSTNNKANFSIPRYGNYTVYVDVSDKYGNIITKAVPVKITADWWANTPSISMPSYTPGTKMTITGNTSKVVTGAKYKLVYSYNNWQEWGVIQNFSTSKTASFTPSKSGKYDIYVDVMDPKGNIFTGSTSASITGSYKIMVNLRTQVVSVLGRNANGTYTHAVRNMACSTGIRMGSTPSGKFALQQKYRWRELKGRVYGQWSTRITGPILFHSVPYTSPSPNKLKVDYFNKLGSPASAGCVRLQSVDAKWIYDNCPTGTPVEIGNFYHSYLPSYVPVRRIKSSTNWDPTDPTPGNPYYGSGYQ